MTKRTLLELGRVSNLPTVWSNILAAWFLGGMGTMAGLAGLLFGGSCLYTAGMFFNDYCDVAFDTKHRPERPIPSGRISRARVGQISAYLCIVGLASLFVVGWLSGLFGLILVGAIALYDLNHKGVIWAPAVMGFCRFMLYPIGASGGLFQGALPIPVCGIILAFYVMGITYLARGETQPGAPSRWALFPLSLPLFVPLLADLGCQEFSISATIWVAVFSGILLAWMAWILVPFWTKQNRSVGRVVSGLLAGIVLVDAIQVACVLGGATFGFLLLFSAALLLQRTIPAT